MEIRINQTQIEEAINNAATKAIAESLGGYHVVRSIADVVSSEVAAGAIAEAIRQAVAQIDNAALVKALATEIQRATTRAVVGILHEGLVTVICRLRNIGDYSTDDKAEREKILAEIRRE